MSEALPGLVHFKRPGRVVRLSNYPLIERAPVTVELGQVDSGNTAFRTSFLRPGCVLVKRTATGEFVMANDANADHQTAASINTAVTNPGSGGWDGVVTIQGHWGSFTVTLSGSNTDAAVAAAIIAAAAALNPESQAPITAADASGSVSITNHHKGAGTWLRASHATVAGMFTAAGKAARGTDPDVVVTDDYTDMLSGAGVSQAGLARCTRAGHYKAENLINPTAEAVAVLEKRGSIIDGTLSLVG